MRYPRRRLTYAIVAGAILSLYSSRGLAQEHIIQQPQHQWLRLAEEQFNQGLYRLSLQSVRHFLSAKQDNTPAATEQETERAGYLKALCQLKLSALAAEDSAQLVYQQTANPVYRQRLALALGHFHFQREALDVAIPYYETAGISNLTNQEIADSRFELAYAYFNSRNFAKAEPLFAAIKEVQGKYYLAGNYYYGLLAYNDGKYEEALKSFMRIHNEPQYKNIVPYYIAEIYYFMGDRKKALEEAMRLTRRPEKLYYDNELHLLAAQVLFEEQRYGEALPFFEHYYEHTDRIRKEELYEMAYSYYRVNEWKNAIDKFKPLSNTADSLGQTAMYLLGDCYLKTGDKKSARNAFGLCADMAFNKGQQEASLLLYGKLSYELGYNDDAIRSFSDLVRHFPQSAHANEARTHLSDLFVKTGRHEEAFTLLSSVSERNDDFWSVWQKASYGYGIRLLREGNLVSADSLLARSLQRPREKGHEAAAYFWRGDIAYRQKRPQSAMDYFKRFNQSGAGTREIQLVSPQATASNAYLSMGYAAMDLQDFSAARSYFAQAKQDLPANSAFAINASVREADAAFMQKNYKDATALYEKVIASGGEEADYGRLQKGIIAGLLGRASEKTALLHQIASRTPASRYAEDARYELGSTYLEEEKYQQAITALLPLTESGADTRKYATKAWMRIGFAYKELDNHTKAIESYKKVITDYAASDERSAALNALRSLYVETGNPESYASLLKEYNLPEAGMESMDSTYYAAAEAQIAAGRWAAAKSALAAYLDKFPNGAFTTRAHYYKAESHYQLKETELALAAYDRLLALPWNDFSEQAARRSADIAYKAGNYEKAINYFGMLRNSALSPETLQLAYSGMMNALYNSNQLEAAALYADTLLALPALDAEVTNEVRFIKARAMQRSQKNTEALALFQQLNQSNNEAMAAESRFRIAEIYYHQNDLKAAEAAAAEAIKLNSGNDFWQVKSYLLITDILIQQKDYFNAKATLQSIVRNTRNNSLKAEAQQKLAEVKKLEKQQTKLKEE